MVKIVAGDQIVDTPLFSYARSIVKQVRERPEQNPIVDAVDQHLLHSQIDGMQPAKAQSIMLARMGYRTAAALPAILQDTYDALEYDNKPPLKFVVSYFIQYIDDTGKIRHEGQPFDSKSMANPELMEHLKNMLETPNIQYDAFVLTAASSDKNFEIPASRMDRALEEVHDEIFDRTRYIPDMFEIDPELERYEETDGKEPTELYDRLMARNPIANEDQDEEFSDHYNGPPPLDDIMAPAQDTDDEDDENERREERGPRAGDLLDDEDDEELPDADDVDAPGEDTDIVSEADFEDTVALSGLTVPDDPKIAATRLLPILAAAYGGKPRVREEGDGQYTVFVDNVLFNAMERGEKPERYRGRRGGD